MADQGAIGRQHAVSTASAYARAQAHYARAFPRGELWGYSGVAGAHYGAANTAYVRARTHYTRSLPLVWVTQQNLSYRDQVSPPDYISRLYGNPDAVVDLDGEFEGTVRDGGVVQPNVRVIVMQREPPMVLGTTRTDVNGHYKITGLSGKKSDHLLIFLDPPGGSTNNAARLDYMRPVLTGTTVPGQVLTVKATLELPTNTVSGVKDPNFASVVFLAHFNNNLTDVKGKTITNVGSMGFSTAKTKFNAYSLYFNGSAQYISWASHADFAFGVGDYTQEWWLWINDPWTINAATSPPLFEPRLAGASTVSPLTYLIPVTGKLYLRTFVSGADLVANASIAFPTSQWVHVATGRSGGLLATHQNGQLVYSIANSSTFVAANTMYMGNNTGGVGNYLSGYCGGKRYTKGVHRYSPTANFSPPTFDFPDS